MQVATGSAARARATASASLVCSGCRRLVSMNGLPPRSGGAASAHGDDGCAGSSVARSSAIRRASSINVSTICDSGTVLMTSPLTKIWPLPLPEATPGLPPGPPRPVDDTAHDGDAQRHLHAVEPGGHFSASLYTSTWARPHDGQDTISSRRGRRLSDCRIASPTLISLDRRRRQGHADRVADPLR